MSDDLYLYLLACASVFTGGFVSGLISKARHEREIRRYKKLIRHCWYHAGYGKTGYRDMDSEIKKLYRAINGHDDEDEMGWMTMSDIKELPVNDRLKKACDLLESDEEFRKEFIALLRRFPDDMEKMEPFALAQFTIAVIKLGNKI